MPETYSVDFENNTPRTWTLGVYQKIPTSIGLDTVSWKQTTVPRQGKSGVDWTITYDVAIGAYDQIGGRGVYNASQALETELGKAWKCVMEDGVQQLYLDPDNTNVDPDELVISNDSGLLANLGIGMSGQGSVFKRGVEGNGRAQFTVKPKYYIGLFDRLQIGEIISSNVIVGPEEIIFNEGVTKAIVSADMSGDNLQLVLSYA